MKKIISLLLLVAMTAFALASCSPAKDSGNDNTDGTTEQQVTSPDGFDDVTAPPESNKADGTTAKDEYAKNEDTTEKKDKVSNPEEAVAEARKWLGESDPDTGYKYAYSYDGIQKDGDKSYHRVRVSWYIEEQERYSLCGYLLIDKDGNVTKYSW